MKLFPLQSIERASFESCSGKTYAVLGLSIWDVFFVIYLFLVRLMKFYSDIIDPMEQVSLQCIFIHLYKWFVPFNCDHIQNVFFLCRNF